MSVVYKGVPAGDLLLLQERMNRVFEESIRDTGLAWGSWQWVPYVDIFEDDATFKLKMELPGVKREEISLGITDDVLIIRGKKSFEHDGITESYHVIERQYGYFKRSFALPDSVDIDSIEAIYNAGVLEVTLSKPINSKSKKIPIIKEDE